MKGLMHGVALFTVQVDRRWVCQCYDLEELNLL